VRRLFWIGVGAAAGYYVARRVPPAIERTRERGVSGNAALAASAAGRVASSTRAAFATPKPAVDAAEPGSPTDPPPTARREVRP
jgi:hypothetical protein